MNVGAKSDAGSSAWEQLAATPNHDHPIRQQQPTAPPPVVKQTSDVKPPEYGEELHLELVSRNVVEVFRDFNVSVVQLGETGLEEVLVKERESPLLLE